MDIKKWLLALPQFLVLLPAAVSCYFTVKNQMKYSVRMTAALCAAVLVPYSFACAWFCTAFQIDVNIIFMPSLVLFFLLYRCTITTDLLMPMMRICIQHPALRIFLPGQHFSSLGFPVSLWQLLRSLPAGSLHG